MAGISLPVCTDGAPVVVDPPAGVGVVDRRAPYLSCHWIEEGLAFNRRGLHACLIVHHGRGFPKLCDFNGGQIPADQIRAARARIIRENQGGGHASCVGCPHLTRRKWPEPRHLVRLVGIAHFARCNIYCNYCYLQTQDPASFADGFDPYSVAPAIDGLIRDGHLSPRGTFDWGGGEPTIYPEFDAVLRRATRHGCTTWVHTNGTRFPRPLIEGMSARKIHIICSVDAGFPETYQKMKERDFLERVWRTLERYIEAGCEVNLKYIVKEENCSREELYAFCERAKMIGARRLIVDIDYDYPNPSPNVLAALVLLRRLGPRFGMFTTFGSTGAFFAPEVDVVGQMQDVAASAGNLRRAGRRLLELWITARYGVQVVERRLISRLPERSTSA